MIKVGFTNGNSYGSSTEFPTLDITSSGTSTGALSIKGSGMCLPQSFTSAYSIMNLTLLYDSTNKVYYWNIT